jgi:hypothetical protein
MISSVIKMKKTALFMLLIHIFVFGGISAGEEMTEITVQRNDCLICISKKFFENPAEWRAIARANQLKDPYIIYPGEKLKVPVRLLKQLSLNGTFTFVKGDVQGSMDSKKWKPLQINEQIREGQLIRTGRESRAEIVYSDGSSTRIGPDSFVAVQKSGKTKREGLFRRFKLEAGAMLMNLRSATAPLFEIKTPGAVTGARGTEFRVSYDQDRVTRVETLRGKVGVTAMQKGVLVRPNEATLVEKGKQPTDVRTMLPTPRISDLEPLYSSEPVSFRIENVPGAVKSRVEVAEDRDFIKITEETFIEPDRLFEMQDPRDGIFYARASSCDKFGFCGVPSDPLQFRIEFEQLAPDIRVPAAGLDDSQKEWSNVPASVIIPPPAAPHLFTPEITGKSLKIMWSESGQDTKYLFEMSEDSEFRNQLMNMEVDRTEVVMPLPQTGIYYVRVYGINSQGLRGDYSDILSFEIRKRFPYEIAGVIGGIIIFIILL